MALGVGGVASHLLYSRCLQRTWRRWERDSVSQAAHLRRKAHASPLGSPRPWQMGALGQDSEAEEGAVGKESPVSGDGSVPSSHMGPVLAGSVKQRPRGSLSPHWPEGATSGPRPLSRPPVTTCLARIWARWGRPSILPRGISRLPSSSDAFWHPVPGHQVLVEMALVIAFWWLGICWEYRTVR